MVQVNELEKILETADLASLFLGPYNYPYNIFYLYKSDRLLQILFKKLKLDQNGAPLPGNSKEYCYAMPLLKDCQLIIEIININIAIRNNLCLGNVEFAKDDISIFKIKIAQLKSKFVNTNRAKWQIEHNGHMATLTITSAHIDELYNTLSEEICSISKTLLEIKPEDTEHNQSHNLMNKAKEYFKEAKAIYQNQTKNLKDIISNSSANDSLLANNTNNTNNTYNTYRTSMEFRTLSKSHIEISALNYNEVPFIDNAQTKKKMTSHSDPQKEESFHSYHPENTHRTISSNFITATRIFNDFIDLKYSTETIYQIDSKFDNLIKTISDILGLLEQLVINNPESDFDKISIIISKLKSVEINILQTKETLNQDRRHPYIKAHSFKKK